MQQHAQGRIALLIGDVQRGLVDAYRAGEVVGRLRGCADAARERGVMVVFVTVALRAGHPEVHPRNAGFVAAAASGLLDQESEGTQLHPDLGRRPDEPVIVKRRTSGFFGTDLELVLRSMEVASVVLGGITTAGVVLSNFKDAADRDFSVTVLSDGCTDGDPLVHSTLVERVFPSQATVLNCEDWVASLDAVAC